MPYVMFAINYIKVVIKRFLDSKFTMVYEVPKTKKRTIQSFVALYAGPDNSMHFRYSAVLMQVFVTFTHGLAVPMLFPITILGVVNTYIMEKL